MRMNNEPFLIIKLVVFTSKMEMKKKISVGQQPLLGFSLARVLARPGQYL